FYYLFLTPFLATIFITSNPDFITFFLPLQFLSFKINSPPTHRPTILLKATPTPSPLTFTFFLSPPNNPSNTSLSSSSAIPQP
uniref:hypothetical protein n=1 Tax=Cytobacillus oceanisediminis TaxID=665099 RepID=UPI001C92E0FC